MPPAHLIIFSIVCVCVSSLMFQLHPLVAAQPSTSIAVGHHHLCSLTPLQYFKHCKTEESGWSLNLSAGMVFCGLCPSHALLNAKKSTWLLCQVYVITAISSSLSAQLLVAAGEAGETLRNIGRNILLVTRRHGNGYVIHSTAACMCCSCDSCMHILPLTSCVTRKSALQGNSNKMADNSRACARLTVIP